MIVSTDSATPPISRIPAALALTKAVPAGGPIRILKVVELVVPAIWEYIRFIEAPPLSVNAIRGRTATAAKALLPAS